MGLRLLSPGLRVFCNAPLKGSTTSPQDQSRRSSGPGINRLATEIKRKPDDTHWWALWATTFTTVLVISWASALEQTVSDGNQTETVRNVPRKQTLNLKFLNAFVGLEDFLELVVGFLAESNG